MARRRPGRFERQALQESVVRFNPERSALVELLREAASNRTTTVRQARGTANMTVAEVNRARPDVKKVYKDAGLAQARIAHTLDENTASLGPVANSIQAGIALERGQAGRQLQESKADALTDLSSRKVRAREGAQFAVQNANDTYAGEAGKVQRRMLELAREMGAFTSATAGDLRKEDQQNRLRLQIEKLGNSQSERNSLRSAGIDPKSGKPIKGGPLDPNAPRYKNKGPKTKSGGPAATTEKHIEWQTDVDEIRSWAQKYKGKLSRPEIVAKLTKGRSKQTILVDKNGNPLPEGLSGPEKVAAGARKVTLEEIPSYPANLKMSAALDLALDGHLSKQTQQKLHAAGFSIAQLGFPSYGQGRKRRARTVSRPPFAKTRSGQMRPT